MKRWIWVLILLIFIAPLSVNAEENEEGESSNYEIPDSAVDISKANTYPNPTENLPRLEPGELATELLETTDVEIENPELIKMFNESSIRGSKLAVGYNASVYLGEWPLTYQSDETTINWDYKKVNTNFVDNRGKNEPKHLSYQQEQQKKVSGGLTSDIQNADTVKKMMRLDAEEKTKLPLSFSTVIGNRTKEERSYNVPAKNVGYLYAYVPAVNEKGTVTFGEVYLRMKGDESWIEVKNVTEQGTSAWIPLRDYLNFSFYSGKEPK
ncbi:YfkD family protein [Texcoconibacillus texcoconensis]|uniref:YfkD family protein n=1 Tax=Texcoconibacillus texcoconensis TaxID=1095777 RepID=UPI003CCDA2D7